MKNFIKNIQIVLTNIKNYIYKKNRTTPVQIERSQAHLKNKLISHPFIDFQITLYCTLTIDWKMIQKIIKLACWENMGTGRRKGGPNKVSDNYFLFKKNLYFLDDIK